MSIISITGKIKSGKDTVAQIIRQYTDEISQTPTGDMSPYKIYKFADKLKEMVAVLLDCRRSDLENQEFKNTPLPPEWDRIAIIHGDSSNIIDILPPDTPEKELDFVVQSYIPFYQHVQTKLQSMTPRLILQLLGTQGMRKVLHPHVHVLGLFARIGNREKALITDTRFPNEGDACKQRGAILIQVLRPTEFRHPEEWAEFTKANPDKFIHTTEHFMTWLQTNNEELYATMTHASETSMDNYEGFNYVIVNNSSLGDLHKKVEQLLRQENII